MNLSLSRCIALLIPLLLLLSSGRSYAQEGGQLDAGSIPPALKAFADAVVREASLTVEIKDENETWITQRRVITILKEQGKEMGYIGIQYRKKEPIKNLTASIYNAEGELIHKFKTSEFEDVSVADGFSLFDDLRGKTLAPGSNHYPYTIVYEYQQKKKQSFTLPGWYPIPDAHVAVEKSSYTLVAPESLPVRFKMLNLKAAQREFTEKGEHHYVWEVTGLSAVRTEPYSPPDRKYLPMLWAEPVQFSYYGIKGTIRNWQEYGRWVSIHLLQGRDELPEQTVQKVREMTNDLPSTEEKVRKLYAYMQSKCRYVSVQMGIGGMQPMRAEEVDRLGYGDCKGLVNYMKALLAAADIPAYYTEIKSGDEKQDYLEDFASPVQGDHIILCVPSGKDSIWLECTDRNEPFGFLGYFTDDRYGLLCSESGGVLVHTPTYADTLNRRQYAASFALDSSCALSGKVSALLTGLCYEDRDFQDHLGQQDAEKQLRQMYDFPNGIISGYGIAREKTSRPLAKEQFDIRCDRYATVSGDRMYLPLNSVNRLGGVPDRVYHRTRKVYIARGFTETDTLIYALPAHYHPELVPADIDVKNAFGEYHASCRIADGRITYCRNFALRGGTYPSESYESLRGFMQQVYNGDREKLILQKE
ncbi:DUF3857 domain-containing transglutaminase family protein [Compostibacter hankyongensis]|uniref:DUF3857 domain-containing protein n=1 Tax=Compostibacter hankyongensis TaxID=1007089 RepID=A0ABP8G801_9BACT